MIVGDVHLDKGKSLGKSIPGQKINSRLQDQLDLLEFTLKKAVEHNVVALIITGDIFEDPSTSSIIINLFSEWCLSVVDTGIRLIIIAGNHDILRTGDEYYSPLDIIEKLNDNIVVYKQPGSFVIEDDIAFSFYPFRDRKSLNCQTTTEAVDIINLHVKEELSKMPGNCTKVFVGHIAIKGSVYYDEVKDMTNELVLPVEMFDGFHHTIMGHIHSPQNMNETVQHIGSLDISNFGESNHKKKIIVLAHDLYKEIEVPTRKLNSIAIVIPKDEADPTQYVLSEIKKLSELDQSITKIDIENDCEGVKPINKKMIRESLLSNGVFHVESISETKKKETVKPNTVSIKLDMSRDAAIRTYAEKKITDPEKRIKFMTLATSLVEEFDRLG
jgi:DNA repair exonuclease SbcCD nuclease subunit